MKSIAKSFSPILELRSQKHWPRTMLISAIVAVALSISIRPSLSAETGPTNANPNFVLILSDDQSWVGTSVPMMVSRKDSASDFFRTPRLERLAAQGMVFSDGYAHVRHLHGRLAAPDWDLRKLGPLYLSEAEAFINRSTKADEPFFLYYVPNANHFQRNPDGDYAVPDKIAGTPIKGQSR